MFIVESKMEIDRLNNEIRNIHNQMKKVEKEKKEILIKTGDCIESSILESELLELEKRLILETSRMNDALRLQDYQNSCSHIFIEDLIDITPDKSMTVKYCAHCLFTP